MKTVVVSVPTRGAIERLRRTFLPSYAAHMDGRGRHRYVLALYAQEYGPELELVLSATPQGAVVWHAPAPPHPVSMTFVRDQSHRVCPGADFILWADDDFEFARRSVEWYDAAVDFMAEHEQCGVVQVIGAGHGIVEPKVTGAFWTARGLVFRPRRRPDCPFVIPADAVGLPGVHDDDIACWSSYRYGMFAASIGGCPTSHHHAWEFSNGAVTFKVKPGDGEGIHSVDGAASPYWNAAPTRKYLSDLLGVQYGEVASGVKPAREFWRAYFEAAARRYDIVDPFIWRAVQPCM